MTLEGQAPVHFQMNDTCRLLRLKRYFPRSISTQTMDDWLAKNRSGRPFGDLVELFGEGKGMFGVRHSRYLAMSLVVLGCLLPLASYGYQYRLTRELPAGTEL
jgi:hypothetical protein